MEYRSGAGFFILRLFRCITGPKLRRLYYQDRNNQTYLPNKVELYADHVILVSSLLLSFIYHVSPFYCFYYILRHGFPTFAGIFGTMKTLSFIPLSYSIAYLIRGIGRFNNEQYIQFLVSLVAVQNYRGKLGPDEVRSTGIDGYDFEMKSYPVTFCHNETDIRPRRLSSPIKKTFTEKVLHLPLSSLRYIAAHVIGRRMVYPGSNAIFNILLESPLSDGRAKLCRIYNSYRAKLQASDDNQIDVVFIDKRGSPDAKAKGNKLIICCEGNAAYYELGLLEIPLTVGYSVLGWNHPGFAESTGLPFPDQEFCAIDVIVRYAVCRLGFKYEDIYLFAWSIGGYTASCAAMSYPKIAGVILDATFDELFPLAQLRVPTYFQGFTRGMVEEYYNLNIAEQMCRYHGPLLIIRRQHDEMMTFNNNISTNRANYLLIKILQNRYPNLMTPESLKQLWAWLNCINDWDRSSVISSAGVSDSRCKGLLVQYVSINGEGYPWLIGDDLDIREKTRLLLYLATQYMKNCDSTHCAPLPHRFLHKLPEKFFNNS